MRAELRPALLAASIALSVPPMATAQVAQASERTGVHFASFDVALGAVLPDGADTGLAYGAGFELANLPVDGLAGRFGFRFWTAEDPDAGVDIDDGVLELIVKLRSGRGPLAAYVGAGFGAHFVSARIAEMPEVQDERDGFRPGLQLLAGGETSFGDEFFAAFLEGTGSLVADVPHILLQAGVRVRFDRL